MFVKEPDNFLVRIRQTLNLPIRTRCAELTVLLDRGSLLELHTFFPVLIENIFGTQGTLGWSLRTTTESSPEDFKQLQHFLSPCGPLFKLIYTLLKEPCTKYEFPLSFLPSKIRQYLENYHSPPFYADLVHVNPQTKQVLSLYLNPFDFYMFHFAYHLINPWHQRSGSAVTSWNTVYYVLCCDYILHFLPTDPGHEILPAIKYAGKTPPSSQPITAAEVGSELLNITALNKKNQEDLKNLERHPRSEVWRSETVLTVFIDMWLHNDQINSHTEDLNNTFNMTQVRHIPYNELPTGEYMRIVRVLIKQLHSFSASAKADDTHLGELKKIAIPVLQGKFYIFLRNLIHRWPLDGSFRLVLELWLTYIQPWRYPPNNLVKHLNKKEVNPDVEDLNMGPLNSVDKEYLPFIAENLLAYVVIFQQLLPRFGRVDLVSPKMAVMLYRLTKVFDQPNLPQYLQEVEHCVENNQSPSHKYNTWANTLPPLSPTSNWSTNTSMSNNSQHLEATRLQSFSPPMNSTSFLSTSPTQAEKKWSAIVRQKIFELEGPNFCYKPLFSVPAATEIYDLLLQIKRSLVVAHEVVKAKELEEKELYSGIWGFIKSIINNSISSDEFSLSDRMKVPAYLEVSMQNLMDMFDISEVIEEPEPTPMPCMNNSEFMDDYKFLTPEKVRNRIRKLKYDGDPDLHPIRSTENKVLVRLLYHLAKKINEDFGPFMYQLYHNPSFYGRLSRQMLCPPMTVYKYDKSLPGSPRVSSNLPPRVSFRFMASYAFFSYLCFGGFVAYLLGYSASMYVFFIFVVFMFYKCLKAVPYSQPPVRHNYPTEGFGNISFNDSF